MKNVLIIGAGAAGKMIANELRHNRSSKHQYHIIGFLDDDESLTAKADIPVLGKIDTIKEQLNKYKTDAVFIAIPTASSLLIQKILNYLTDTDLEIKIIPGLIEIIEGDACCKQLRKIEPSDLLGREEITFEIEKISSYYENKTVFVTGAGGSIGSEILQQLLKLPIKKIVAFGHGETSIHTLLQTIGKEKRFSYVIGDVKDVAKLRWEIEKHRPDILFHAAAHKHVPLMEEYPDEAIKNNIIGTYQCAFTAKECGVKKFVLISTDKAVNPTSVMGASKRIAEQIILSMNQALPKQTNSSAGTQFILTRFGNVLGSRGSVVPIFSRQIENGGPVTVTHPEMTRFFMSIREAARLVIKSATVSKGNIFILDMGKAVKIHELAKTMIKLHGYHSTEIDIVFTGARPGEKLYEEILTDREKLSKTDYSKLLVSDEPSQFYQEKELPVLIQQLRELAESYDKEKIRQFLMNAIKR